MSFLTLRLFRLTPSLTRPFTSTPAYLHPTNPNPSHPSAEGDAARIPRDKQGASPQTVPGGAAGAPTDGGSGGPTEQSGMPDPGIPKGDVEGVKEGMTSGGDKPARG